MFICQESALLEWNCQRQREAIKIRKMSPFLAMT
jgi:hypothetical protein